MGATRLLVPVDGPYRGQVMPYAAHVADHLLAFGQAREPTDAELYEHQHGQPMPERASAPPKGERPEKPKAGFPRHTGGGMYVLSDGSKVKSKKKAVAAQAKLDG